MCPKAVVLESMRLRLALLPSNKLGFKKGALTFQAIHLALPARYKGVNS